MNNERRKRVEEQAMRMIGYILHVRLSNTVLPQSSLERLLYDFGLWQ